MRFIRILEFAVRFAVRDAREQIRPNIRSDYSVNFYFKIFYLAV